MRPLPAALLFTIVSVGLEFAIGLLLAPVVERLKRSRLTVRTLLLIPWTLPTAIIAILWMWIFNELLFQKRIVAGLTSGSVKY